MERDRNSNRRSSDYSRRESGAYTRRSSSTNSGSSRRSTRQESSYSRRSPQHSAPQHSTRTNSRANTRSPQRNLPARQSQLARTGTRQPAHSARRGTYTYQPQRRKLPIFPILATVAALILVIGIVFAIKGCVGSKQAAPEATETPAAATASQAVGTAATAAAEGQIIMTLGGDEETLVLKGEDYLEAGCHAVDKKDGNVTSSVQVSGEVDTSTPGDYTVTYTATNSKNEQATRTRTVRVVDSMDKDTDGITVFMYHYVYDDDNPPEDTKDTNYLSQSKLRKQLEWLTENDYYFPSYQELRAYVDGTHSLPKKSVVLTFDDAQSGFLKYGIPVLEEYKVPATSFVICDRKGAKKNIKKYASEYVTFQSHSYSLHNDGNTNIGRGGHIYDLSESELVADTKKAAKMLGTNEAFAYPYGDVSDSAPSALETAGLLCAFTINYDQVHPGDNPYKLSRIRVFGEGDLSGFIYQAKTGQG